MLLTPGHFCWCETVTRDPAGSARFYGELLGWQPREESMGPAGASTLFSLDGRDVAGAAAMSARPRHPTAGGYWLSHILCEDAEQLSESAAGLGGGVTMPPTTIPGVGRLAILTDPRSASFALWQGAGDVEPWPRLPGYPCWFELNTGAPEVAEYYCALLGWRTETRRYDRDYTVFFKDDTAVASVAVLPPGSAVADHWLPFFAITGCGTIVSRATDLGASIRLPGTLVPGLGRYAVIVDPFEAAFAVKQNL
ncbi:MAG: VOC family protein [Gammaproteobacteria bacterium]|nr:VOC family protein [Gammaproteobacteria bacterium]